MKNLTALFKKIKKRNKTLITLKNENEYLRNENKFLIDKLIKNDK